MRLDKHMTVLLIVFAALPSTIYSILLIPWIFYILARRGGKVASRALMPAWPALFLMVQGLLFSGSADVTAVIRDGWYILKMLLLIQAGALIGYYTPIGAPWIRPMAWATAVISLHQVALVITGLGDENSRNLVFISVLFVPFILKYYPGTIPIRLILVLPTIITIVLAESRTGLLVLIIAWIGARGAFISKNRMTAWVLVLIILGSIASQFLPEYNPGNPTFLGKVQHSLTEISLEEGLDRRSMYGNWRGFEAYRAISTWKSGSAIQQVFGGGFGTFIDLDTVAILNEQEFEQIPFAHNGFFTVLVKFGLLGIAVFGYLLFMPFFMLSKIVGHEEKLTFSVATTASIVLLFTTVSIAGPLNKSSLDGVCVLFGFALGAAYWARTSRSRSKQS